MRTSTLVFIGVLCLVALTAAQMAEEPSHEVSLIEQGVSNQVMSGAATELETSTEAEGSVEAETEADRRRRRRRRRRGRRGLKRRLRRIRRLRRRRGRRGLKRRLRRRRRNRRRRRLAKRFRRKRRRGGRNKRALKANYRARQHQVNRKVASIVKHAAKSSSAHINQGVKSSVSASAHKVKSKASHVFKKVLAKQNRRCKSVCKAKVRSMFPALATASTTGALPTNSARALRLQQKQAAVTQRSIRQKARVRRIKKRLAKLRKAGKFAEARKLQKKLAKRRRKLRKLRRRAKKIARRSGRKLRRRRRGGKRRRRRCPRAPKGKKCRKLKLRARRKCAKGKAGKKCRKHRKKARRALKKYFARRRAKRAARRRGRKGRRLNRFRRKGRKGRKGRRCPRKPKGKKCRVLKKRSRRKCPKGKVGKKCRKARKKARRQLKKYFRRLNAKRAARVGAKFLELSTSVVKASAETAVTADVERRRRRRRWLRRRAARRRRRLRRRFRGRRRRNRRRLRRKFRGRRRRRRGRKARKLRKRKRALRKLKRRLRKARRKSRRNRRKLRRRLPAHRVMNVQAQIGNKLLNKHLKNTRNLANQVRSASSRAVARNQARINRHASRALKGLKNAVSTKIDDSVCDCTPYIEAAKIKSELLIQKQRADAEKARNDARAKKMQEAAEAAKLEAEAAKKAAEMVQAARLRAKADAEKMIASLGSNVPASVADKIRKQMEASTVKNTEKTVLSSLPKQPGAQGNLNAAVEKIRLASTTLGELKGRIKAMKKAMSSKKLHMVIKKETEGAMRKYVEKTRKQRAVETQGQQAASAGIKQWVPYDAKTNERKYKYIATDTKPSYLVHLKSASKAATEALENHSATLTFLEDDQIAHAQAAALKEAELLRREQASAARKQAA